MDFFKSAVGVLQTLVIALGAGLAIWGAINLLEGYGNDNPQAQMCRAHKEASSKHRDNYIDEKLACEELKVKILAYMGKKKEHF